MTREEAIEIIEGLDREQRERLLLFLNELKKEHPAAPAQEPAQAE